MTNPVLGTFYVLVWVGIVPASLLLRAGRQGGQPGAHAQPAAGEGHRRRPRRPGWPRTRRGSATGRPRVGLFAFVWQELVNPQSAYLGSVRLWLAAYLAIMLIGAAVFGDVWLERADPFEVYSTLLAHLSAWGRDGDRLVVRSPLANLATVTPRPGLVAVVSVLFGSTAFDTYKDTIPWQRFVIDVGLDDAGHQLRRAAGVLPGRRRSRSPSRRCRPAWRRPARTPYAAATCPPCSPTR